MQTFNHFRVARPPQILTLAAVSPGLGHTNSTFIVCRCVLAPITMKTATMMHLLAFLLQVAASFAASPFAVGLRSLLVNGECNEWLTLEI